MPRRLWRTLLLATALAASGVGAFAQPSTLEFRRLGLAEGLSSLAVTAVAVDARGLVWLGSTAAADRYDGVRIRTFRSGVSEEDGYVYALATEPGGPVWAGGVDGLWRLRPGATAFAPLRFEGLDTLQVSALAVQGDALWIGTRELGLLRLADGRARHYTAARGHLASDAVGALAPLASGRVAVGTDGGVSWIDPASPRVRHDTTAGVVTALAEVGRRLWAGTASGEVVALSGARQRLEVGSAVSALAPSEVDPGRVWVATGGAGVRVLDTQAASLSPFPDASGLPEPFGRTRVLSLAERGGRLWLGTLRGAYVADVSPPRFAAYGYGPSEPLAVPEVFGAHLSRRDSMTVWAGTGGGGLHRIDRRTGRAEAWFSDPGHPLSVLFAIQEGEGGALWLGGPNRANMSLWRFQPGTGEPTPFPLSDAGGNVADIAPSQVHPGHLWVSTSTAGLIRFDTRQRRISRRYTDVIPATDVWQALETGNDVWVATDGAGLWRIDLLTDGAERIEGTGCEIDPTLVSLAARGDGPLWIGGARSGENTRLWRLDRETLACRAFTPDDGLPPKAIGGVFTDARGRVWLSTNLGLVRFDPETEVFSPFTEADGLATSTLYWYARDQSPTGEIAVGGDGGLTVFDPDAITVESTGVPVAVTGLRVDGADRLFALGEPLALDLSHRENDVEFAYAALDLRQQGKTRYRVRLRGQSDRWEAADPETRYSALSPGRYTFEVAATNPDGFWSEPLAVPIRIRPPFWQTVPFWLLIFAMGGAVGYAAHRYRIAQIQRVERTRRRIADDLHDDIGSKISSVALRLDMARMRGSLPEAERQRLETLAATARSVVGDLRDTVWLVDAGHDDLASLLSRMEQFAGATLDGRGTVTAPEAVDAVPLAMEPRRDLYLLFTEALHNAVRHSGATHIAVALTASGGRVGFTIEDDGTGFDPDAVARGGRGLTTMRQRANALGGTLAWAPRKGGGTVVSFSADLG